jgi:DNA invertase Pin-like site-specific DNA recombinase
MQVGYARVSTADQNLDLQRDALRRAGCRRIHEDRASGSDTNRPELRECLGSLVAGDCLVVWRLDRLGRSLADLIRIVTQLEARGISLQSIMERMDTASPAGRLMFHVLGALAEFERNLIRERILAGLAAARARGRRIGRPRKVGGNLARRLRHLVRRPGMTVTQAAGRFGVSRATAFRALARPQEAVLSVCGEIKKRTDLLIKYVINRSLGITGGGSGGLEKICFQD